MLGDIGQTGEGEQVVALAKECFDRAGVISAELAFLLALTFSWQGPRPDRRGDRPWEHVPSSPTRVADRRLHRCSAWP